jgi:hypothetical protein
MGMPAEHGLSVVYVLADQWIRERQMLKALGVDDPAPLDVLVGRTRVASGDREPTRAEQAIALGGEVTIRG